MRVRFTTAGIALALIALFSVSAAATETNTEYTKALANYFNVSEGVVTDIAAMNIATDDLPVVFFFAEKSGLSPKEVAQLRLRGDKWAEIAKVRGIHQKEFFVIVAGKIPSKTFAPIIAKFKSTPIQKWSSINLTDSDIVNLVNVRFVASQHDYSIFKTMELRDAGHDFAMINHEIMGLKAELCRADDERRMKAALAERP